MIIINQQGYCNKKFKFLWQFFVSRTEYINGIAILICRKEQMYDSGRNSFAYEVRP